MFEEEDYGENLIVSTRTEYDAEENVLRPNQNISIKNLINYLVVKCKE